MLSEKARIAGNRTAAANLAAEITSYPPGTILAVSSTDWRETISLGCAEERAQGRIDRRGFSRRDAIPTAHSAISICCLLIIPHSFSLRRPARPPR